MRTIFNRLITTSVLKQMDAGSSFVESFIEDSDAPLKNVCAKISPKLADDIDNVCELLGFSKRRFIEAAFIEALRQAGEIITTEGLHEYIEERANNVKMKE